MVYSTRTFQHSSQPQVLHRSTSPAEKSLGLGANGDHGDESAQNVHNKCWISFVWPMALIRRNFMKLSYQWYWIPENYEKIDNITQNSRKTNTIQNHSRKCPRVPSQAHLLLLLLLLLLLIFSAALVHSVLPCFLLAGNWSIHSCNSSLVFFEISFVSCIFSDFFSWKSFSLLANFHNDI